MKTSWKSLALAALLASVANNAMAAQSPVNANLSISVSALQEKVQVSPEGERRVKWVQPSAVVPGDEVVYAITYKNKGKTPSDRVVITNVIPQQMKYRSGSAINNAANVRYSVDGGKTFEKPEALQVRAADGQLRPASPRDYTHIQWEILDSLAPGAEGIVGFRAVQNY